MSKHKHRYVRKPVRGSTWFIWIVGVILIGAILAMGFAAVQSTPAQPKAITDGTPAGAAAFPAGDTAQGGQGATVDGIQCASQEQLAYHVHSHLTLLVDGKQIAIPQDIGIVPAKQGAQGCDYWLHTHDATGVIHVESPVSKTFTLGDFFGIWGQTLSAQNVAGYTGTVTAYVGDKQWTDSPSSIPLDAHAVITLEVGKTVTPPPYTFQGNL